MISKSRIQAALIKHLHKFGSIELRLPDGMDVMIGITENTKHGEVKNEDYCWVSMQQHNRSVSMDRYQTEMLYDCNRCMVNSQDSGAVYLF